MMNFIRRLFSKKPVDSPPPAEKEKIIEEPFDLEHFNSTKDVKMFALSTCIHCRMSMNVLEECGAPYNCVYIDQLFGDDRQAVVEEVKKYNPKVSFPTVVIKNSVIIGFNKAKIETTLKEELS